MRQGLAALAALVLAASVQAAPVRGRTDVATFIARAEALRAKGFRALFSGDLKVVRAEAEAASRQFQIDKAARIKAGDPISCPPKGASMGPFEFIDELKRIPVAERGMPLKDGMAWVSRRRYPCPLR